MKGALARPLPAVLFAVGVAVGVVIGLNLVYWQGDGRRLDDKYLYRRRAW